MRVAFTSLAPASVICPQRCGFTIIHLLINWYTRQYSVGSSSTLLTYSCQMSCRHLEALLGLEIQSGFLHICVPSAEMVRTSGGEQDTPLSPFGLSSRVVRPFDLVAQGSKRAEMGAFWSPRAETSNWHSATPFTFCGPK